MKKEKRFFISQADATITARQIYFITDECSQEDLLLSFMPSGQTQFPPKALDIHRISDLAKSETLLQTPEEKALGLVFVDSSQNHVIYEQLNVLRQQGLTLPTIMLARESAIAKTSPSANSTWSFLSVFHLEEASLPLFHSELLRLNEKILFLKIQEDWKHFLSSHQEAMQISNMAQGITHEINNFLTIIKSQAYNLLRGVKASSYSNAQVLAKAKGISESADSASDFIETTRKSLVECDNPRLQKITTESLLQKFEKYSQFILLDYDMTLTSHLEAEAHSVVCDELQLTQAVIEIITFICKAPIADRKIHLSLTAENKYLVIRVTAKISSDTETPEKDGSLTSGNPNFDPNFAIFKNLSLQINGNDQSLDFSLKLPLLF